QSLTHSPSPCHRRSTATTTVARAGGRAGRLRRYQEESNQRQLIRGGHGASGPAVLLRSKRTKKFRISICIPTAYPSSDSSLPAPPCAGYRACHAELPFVSSPLVGVIGPRRLRSDSAMESPGTLFPSDHSLRRAP